MFWDVDTRIKSVVLVSEAARTDINNQVEWGCVDVSFLRGSMYAEGMGCGERWVIWVLREDGTAGGRRGVS